MSGILEATPLLREVKIAQSFRCVLLLSVSCFWESPSVIRSSNLAGVDATLDRIANFIVRNFALQGRSIAGFGTVMRGIPGILLCGVPGSGRTSVAKAAMKRLSGDPRVFSRKEHVFSLFLRSQQPHIDHLYIDLAKLADERAATLKALFDKWIDISSWHKPSVLVLDNLDRIVGPELEVC